MESGNIRLTVLTDEADHLCRVDRTVDALTFSVSTHLCNNPRTPSKNELKNYFRKWKCDVLVVAYTMHADNIKAIQLVRNEIGNGGDIKSVPITVIIEDGNMALHAMGLYEAGALSVMPWSQLYLLGSQLKSHHRNRSLCFSAGVVRLGRKLIKEHPGMADLIHIS